MTLRRGVFYLSIISFDYYKHRNSLILTVISSYKLLDSLHCHWGKTELASFCISEYESYIRHRKNKQTCFQHHSYLWFRTILQITANKNNHNNTGECKYNSLIFKSQRTSLKLKIIWVMSYWFIIYYPGAHQSTLWSLLNNWHKHEWFPAWFL